MIVPHYTTYAQEKWLISKHPGCLHDSVERKRLLWKVKRHPKAEAFKGMAMLTKLFGHPKFIHNSFVIPTPLHRSWRPLGSGNGFRRFYLQ